jgi:hypothetical protein
MCKRAIAYKFITVYTFSLLLSSLRQYLASLQSVIIITLIKIYD